ncbi:MAG: PEP-CTERM system TPR-repeat protein PrsT [Gammaproteobacteria bacterium]|nr:PEP-CTERM system TPR-repeat protein PrsT [Gammaproteobacteria bacterium]
MKLTSLIIIASLFILSSCSPSLTPEEYVQRANAFADKKEWKSAIIEYKNAVKLSPKNAQIRYLLGKVYIDTFESEDAIKELTKAVELGLDKNKVLVLLGRAYTQSFQNDKIINTIYVNDSLSTGEQATILAIRAEAYLQKNSPENALTSLKQANTKDLNNTDVRLAWSKYESKYGTVENRIKWLQPLLDKNIANAWSQMGEIEKTRNELESAEQAYTKAITARKFLHQDSLSRALVRVQLKKYDEALEDIQVLKDGGFNSPLIPYTEGLIAFHRKDIELAQTKIDEVMKVTNKFPPSIFILGLIQFEKQNYESALITLNQYLDVQPGNIQAKFIIANILIQQGKIEQAIGHLEALNKADPTNNRIASALGSAYVKNGQLDKGVSLFKAAALQNPTEASTQLMLGSALIRDENTAAKGREALIKALDIDPGLEQANMALYLSYMQSKAFNKAVTIAQNMVDSTPDEPLSYNLLAHAHMAKGDKTKADKLFESTLAKFPSDPMTSGNVARLKIQAKQIEEAKSIFLKVLEKHPSELRTLISLAVIESRLGNNDKKVEYLKKAVELNPKVTSPKLILAAEYEKQGEYQLVLDLLRDVEDKDNLEVQLLTIKAKIGFKKYDYSLTLLKNLIAKQPELSIAYFLRGKIYTEQKDLTNAKESFEKVLSIVPEHYASSLMLTQLALLNNDRAEFEKRIKPLIKQYPERPEIAFLSAKLDSVGQDYKSAIATLEALIKKTPNVEAVIDLARNKWVSGDKAGAIEGLELWQDNNQDEKRVLMLLSQFYLTENRPDDAHLIHIRLDKLIPNNPILLNNMAWTYKNSDIKLGIRYAKKALSLAPNNPYIEDTLAMLLLADNNISEALVHSQSAAKQVPEMMEVQINYATVLIADKQKDSAKNLLNQIKNKTKDPKEQKQIKALLNAL